MDYELEESRSEAAVILGHSSHLTLYALSEGISMAAARRKLMAHISGASMTPSAEENGSLLAEQNPGSSSAGTADAGTARAGDCSTLHDSPHDSFLARLESSAPQGRIVAYIRPPAYADPNYPRPNSSR
jgi:hypothetical protein